MAYDAANWISGNSTNPNTTISTVNITAVGTALAPNRLYIAELRIKTTPTGSTLTVDLAVQDSPTGSTQWSTLAAFPQQTTGMTITNPENTTAATQAAFVRRAFRVSEARPFVHLGVTATGGANTVYPDVTVLILPAETVTNT